MKQISTACHHAKMFGLEKNTDCAVLAFTDQSGEEILVALSHDGRVPSGTAEYEYVIKTPVERVVCLSGTYIAFISAIGKMQSIVGVDKKSRIYSSELRNMIDNGDVAECGNEQNLDIEKIIELAPDVVFAWWIDPASEEKMESLKKAGIPVIAVLDYLEQTPLGKAEWIRFFGAFYGCDSIAAGIFSKVETEYMHLVEKASSLVRKPYVLINLSWQDAWYLPGDSTFSVNFLRDAGAVPAWKTDNPNEIVPYDAEYVFSKWAGADFWINPGSAVSLNEMKQVSRFSAEFEAFKNGKVFNNNLKVNTDGANDYWETGTVYPDRVLRDLISIFHPELLPNHQCEFYRKLE
ncbi:MAG: ABC transporter substrate-binding protein [Bacteroidetes bacterium]|nr:ABC transporter substrate-binding protein [Bacteroidota bacterium]MBU1719059.1 ABC transporter substrate-binding protein [Bacteroidota bacterium]